MIKLNTVANLISFLCRENTNLDVLFDHLLNLSGMEFSREFYSEDYPFDQFKGTSEWSRHERIMKALEEDGERITTDPEYAEEIARIFNLRDLFSRMDKDTWDYACRKYGCPND